MVDGFVDGVIGDVVGGRLGAEKEMIADVLFDEAMAIVATDDGIGEIEVLEYGLQLSAILFRDLTTKDDGDLVGLPDGAVGIEKSLAQFIEGSAAMENEVVAILDLGKEEAMLATGWFALLFGEEGSEAVEPLPATEQQIAGGKRIGQFLQPLGVTATQKCVAGLLKPDALFPQAQG